MFSIFAFYGVGPIGKYFVYFKYFLVLNFIWTYIIVWVGIFVTVKLTE